MKNNNKYVFMTKRCHNQRPYTDSARKKYRTWTDEFELNIFWYIEAFLIATLTRYFPYISLELVSNCPFSILAIASHFE